MSRVEIVIPILKNCLVVHDISKWHILFSELKTVAKIRCPRKRIFKAARDEGYYIGLLGRKDRRTKIGNLHSCRCGCKLRESKTGKAFTQLKHNKYSLQTKTQKPADEYFRKARETPGEFVALVIVLRFLLANQKMGLIKNAHALYRDNGPLIYEGKQFQPQILLTIDEFDNNQL